MIYDVFTDASIDNNTKLGCAGIVIIDRDTNQQIYHNYILIPNTTNNKAEIIGVTKAVYAIAYIYLSQYTKPFEVNIFSDSKISIFGVREWMPDWIRNQTPEGVFINSSRVLVANQEFFRAIFNLITTIGLKVRFYHQKGHVSLNNPVGLFNSEKVFYESNYRTIASLGINPRYLAMYNNLVDNTSRNLIKDSQSDELRTHYDTFTAEYYKEDPAIYYCKKELIESYLILLKGGTNYPLHQINE